jgi:hypothetical protein
LDEPPERQGQAVARKAREQHVEQTRIFRGEHAREPIVLGVVDGELRLHAGEPFVMRQERLERAPQLVGLGPVFGVEDRHEHAACEGERDIERLGLGARPDIGRDHEFIGQAEPHRFQRGAGRAVVRFQDELDVELFRRPVERVEGSNELLDRSHLAVKRDDHRVGRQAGIRAARQGRGRPCRRKQAQQPQRDPGDEHHGEKHAESGRDQLGRRDRGGGPGHRRDE